LAAVPLPVVVFVVTTAASFWTEVCSNVATANILLPIMASLAAAIGQNPLVLMVPVTIGCSLAFMLPVATPPNALVMAEGLRNLCFCLFFS
jgi:sodium-dependent dicarboxylate transporter 2/3/5